MKKSKGTSDREIQIEKKYILDLLKENDCETLEELKNLVIFLNNENKRLHSINVESLKKINILSVRVNNLEKVTKNYDEQFYQSKINHKKKYKKKLVDLKNQLSVLKNYTKDKENEYNRLIEEQDNYFQDFFINLNKNINLVISCDKEKNFISSDDNSDVTENNEETYSDNKLHNNTFSSCPNNAYPYNKTIEDRTESKLKKKKNTQNLNQEKLNNEKNSDTKNDDYDYVNKTEFQKNFSNQIDHPFLSKKVKSSNEEEEDVYTNVEKIKSLSGSIKIIDNDLLNSKGVHLFKDKEFVINSKQMYKLDNSVNGSVYKNSEKKNTIQMDNKKEKEREKGMEKGMEKEKSSSLIQSQDSKEKLDNDKKLNKKIEVNKYEAQKTLNKIIDYNIDIKNRLNNLLEDMYIDDNKKIHNLDNNKFNSNIYNTFSKTLTTKNNIMDILNNKINISCIEDINNSKPKYVKFNTIHREVINPRQNFFNQTKKSIDHIICL